MILTGVANDWSWKKNHHAGPLYCRVSRMRKVISLVLCVNFKINWICHGLGPIFCFRHLSEGGGLLARSLSCSFTSKTTISPDSTREWHNPGIERENTNGWTNTLLLKQLRKQTLYECNPNMLKCTFLIYDALN